MLKSESYYKSTQKTFVYYKCHQFNDVFNCYPFVYSREIDFVKGNHQNKKCAKVWTMFEQGRKGSDRTVPVSEPFYLKCSLTQTCF